MIATLPKKHLDNQLIDCEIPSWELDKIWDIYMTPRKLIIIINYIQWFYKSCSWIRYINTCRIISCSWYSLFREVMVFNTTFNNTCISFISWRSVLLVEEIWVPRENHRPVASHLTNFITLCCTEYTSP